MTKNERQAQLERAAAYARELLATYGKVTHEDVAIRRINAVRQMERNILATRVMPDGKNNKLLTDWLK